MALSRFLLYSLFFLIVFPLSAQETRVNADPAGIYQKALNLYDLEKYAAAAGEFRHYLESGQDFQLRINSEWYLAFCAMQLNQPDAEQQLLDMLETQGDHPKANYARFLLGEHYYKKGNHSKAIEYLESCDELNLTEEERKTYYFALGYCYFQKDKFEEATKQLEKIQGNKDKYYYPSNYYLGYMAMSQQKDERALGYFFKILPSKVYSDKAPLYISRIYYRQGKYRNVISFTDTLEKNPAWADLSWERGKSYYQLGEYQESVNNFERGRGTRELTTEEKYMLGRGHYELKSYDKAYVFFTSINRPGDSLMQNALIYAGDCFLKLDKKTNARNAFYEASKLTTDLYLQELAWFNYAKLSIEPPFKHDAVNNLSKFLELYPSSEFADEARSLLSEALLSSRRYSDAIPVLESIRVKNEKTKKLYQEICYFYASELLRQDASKALEYYEKARTYPMDEKINAQIDFWVGEIQFEAGEIVNATRSWEKFVQNTSAKNTDIYTDGLYNLGYAYFRQKEFGRAISQFKLYTQKEAYAGEKKPKYLDGMTRLGDCYFMRREYENAADAYLYVTSKEAVNSDYALFQIGMIRGIQGKSEEKIQTMKRIAATNPNSEYVDDALYEIASVYLQKQNLTEALRGFSFLLEDYPDGIYAKRSYLNKGLILYNLKRYDESLENYKIVVEKYSKTKETEEAIRAVKEISNEIGKGPELLEWLKSIGENISISYEDSTLYSTALKWYQNKNCEKAELSFSSYLEKFPAGHFTTEAAFYRSECRYSTQKYDEAIDGYKKAIEKRYPEFLEVSLRKLAAIYLWKKMDAEALTPLYDLEKLASNKENIVFSQLNLMYANYRLNNHTEAKAYAEKVLANEKTQKGDLTEARMILSNVLVLEEKYAEAKPYLEKVEKDKEVQKQKGAEAKYLLCLIAFKSGNIKNAQDQIFELDEKYANQVYWVAKAFVLLGETYIVQKDYFNARAVLQSVYENYDRDNDGIKAMASSLLQSIEGL